MTIFWSQVQCVQAILLNEKQVSQSITPITIFFLNQIIKNHYLKQNKKIKYLFPTNLITKNRHYFILTNFAQLPS